MVVSRLGATGHNYIQIRIQIQMTKSQVGQDDFRQYGEYRLYTNSRDVFKLIMQGLYEDKSVPQRWLNNSLI